MTNKENNYYNNDLNETIQGSLIPLASSTGIKEKKPNSSIDRRLGFQDSIIYTCNNNLDQIQFDENNETIRNGLESKYLLPSKAPDVKCESLFDDLEESDTFTYFYHRTEPISVLSLHPSLQNSPKSHILSSDLPNTSDTVPANMSCSIDMNKIDEYLKLNTDSPFNDLTKLAHAVSRIPPRESGTPRNSNNSNSIRLSRAQLLSNRTFLLWVGVSVRNNVIKSFKLSLNSDKPGTAQLSISSPTNVFHFANQAGNSYHQTVQTTLQPREEKKFYVVFHPTDSAYHNGMVLVQLGNRKFKIHLFGYAEPANIELIDFRVSQNDPAILIKSCDRSALEIRVFNSGARTAYVAFFSFEKSARFQPRAFLVIPKTTIDVQVSSLDQHASSISFFMVFVDEEVRRSCRSNYSSINRNELCDLIDGLQILGAVPEEKLIKQHELPQVDWRRHLSRQINTSYRMGTIVLTTKRSHLNKQFGSIDLSSELSSVASGKQISSDSLDGSVRTIDKHTISSSMTCNSVFSNIKKLSSKTIYMNSAASFVQSLSDNTLGGVVVLRDVNQFPDTIISHISYLGVLIRNNNSFPVNWLMSKMILMSSNALSSTPTTERRDCSTFSSPSPSPLPGDTNSILSLASVPIYNPATSMSAGTSSGLLKPLESVLVPVRFRPQHAGLVECRCNIKLYTDSDDMFFEKDIDFAGLGVRKKCLDSKSRSILGLSVSPHCLSFSNASVGRQAEQRLQLWNTSNHFKDIFFSHLERPFEIRVSKTCLEKGKSLISIYFHSNKTGVFNDALVVSDDEGYCTYVSLRAELK